MTEGTEENLYLIVLPLGRLNLHPDGSNMNSKFNGC